MPLLGELSRSSRDSFEWDSDSKESRDDWLHSPKSGKNKKCHFWRNEAERPRILSNRNPIRKNSGTFGFISSKVAFFCFATFWRVKPIVPRFFRIGFRFERILGRSAELAQKRQKTRNATFGWVKPIVPGFFRIGIRFERISGRWA